MKPAKQTEKKPANRAAEVAADAHAPSLTPNSPRARKRYCRLIMAAVMFAVFFAAYMTLYRHVLIFHEQHHLFRFSWSYIAETAHFDGFFVPMAAFLAQFAYYPWLGAAVWSAILVGVYAMSQSAIRRLTGLYDVLQLSAILPCWMFFSTVAIDGSLVPAIKALICVAAIWILALIAGRYVPKVKGLPVFEGSKGWWPAVAGPVIFAVVFGLFYYDSYKPLTVTLPDGKERHLTRSQVKIQRQNEKLMIKSIQAMRRGDWDEVINLSNQQATTGAKNHLMSYFRAMALYNKGALLDHLFDLPQYHGPNSLFFPWKADRNQAEYGGFLYEQLGALNTALHWEFEAMVGWGETAHHLINLSRYLIQTHRGEQARKFIAPLKQTLFYRDVARNLEQWRADGFVPGLRNALDGVPQTPMRADNVLNLAGDTKYIVQYDPENEMAKQYLMLTLLMSGNVGVFYHNLTVLYPPTGKPLPKIFDEALCLVRLNYGSARLAADGYVISPETDAAYRAFLAEEAKGKLASFTPAQKRTYWYYLLFLSPTGKQITF